MDRLITLQLGGQERTLLYGTMGYFAHIKDVTKKDSFEWLADMDKKIGGSTADQVSVMSEDVAILVYAGLNSYLDSKDQDNVPLEKCVKWCRGLNSDEVSRLIGFAFNSFAPETQGEVNALAPGQENGQKVSG